MKRIKQIAAVFCATACTFTTAFADESGLESATPPAPAITDPVNPQPGMLFSAFGTYDWMRLRDADKLQSALGESIATLPKMPAVKTGIDKSDKFTIACAKDVEVAAIRWEGFLKCTLAKTYTFVVDKQSTRRVDYPWWCGYAIAINGKICTVDYEQHAFDVELKVGFNKVEIVTLLPRRVWNSSYEDGRNLPLLITVKPKGSIIEPVQLSPGMLFYDDNPDLTATGVGF